MSERRHTTRFVDATASAEASDNVQSVALATEELASSLRKIWAQIHESDRIAASTVKQADETDGRMSFRRPSTAAT